MEIEALINEIISFPVNFQSLGDISIYSFLKDIGYFEAYNKVQENDIAKGLISHPEYINGWFGWSDDKRTTSGWYIQQKENGHYLVGCYPKNEKFIETQYSEIIDACAAFIKREIESVRSQRH